MGRWMFLSGADFQTPCFTRMLFRLEDLIKKALQRAYGDSHPNFIPIELSPWRHSFIMIMGLLVSSFAACLRLSFIHPQTFYSPCQIQAKTVLAF